jgi:putative ABC transport system permease protein
MMLLQRVPTQRMQEPRLDVALDPQAAAFAVALALLSVILAGILPAVRASRGNLADALKDAAGSVVPAGRWRDVLMALQVALALMLMTSGVLVTRSLDAARNQDLGLRPDGVIGMRLQFSGAGDRRANASKVQRLLDGALALPGVRVATVSPGFPLENVAAGGISTGRGALMGPLVSANHFATLGVRIVAGREYTAEDLVSSARVVIINQAAARKHFAGVDPVGRMLGKHQVIGVVADHAAMAGMSMHTPMAFIRPPMQLGSWPSLLVRVDGRPSAFISSLRQLARRVDPEAPILRIATLRDHLDGLHHHLLVASWLLGLCGLASLALAAMGVHSLLACRVARQRREIGIRMALGAGRVAVVRLVVGRLVSGVALGAVAGAVGGFYLSRAFRSLFAGAASLHAGALALSAVALVAVALLASAGPSWKAARVEPSTALRGE